MTSRTPARITPARMSVVKKEDKEFKLKAFVEHGIAAVATGGFEGKIGIKRELCIVAQGATSPVIRAVASLARQLAANDVTLRVIFTKTEPVCSGLPPQGPLCAYRTLADVRCHDAHELLVLGTYVAWIGDSMRRNPSTTDSFELHSNSCAATTASVATSFERLWAMSTPTAMSVKPSQNVTMELAGQLAAIAGDGGSAVTALTRH